MKQVNMAGVLVDLEGNEIQRGQCPFCGSRDKADGQPATIAHIVTSHLIATKPKNADAAEQIWRVGQKINSPDFSGELEDAEFKTLRQTVEENPAGYAVVVQGQVVAALREIK